MKNLLDIQSLDYETLSAIIDRTLSHNRRENFGTLKNQRIALLFSEVSLNIQPEIRELPILSKSST